MVADEGHRLKNPESRTAVVLTEEIRAHHRIILTGTPIQNRVEDLYAIVRFLQFEPWSAFGHWHRHIQLAMEEDAGAGLAELRGVVQPLMLRLPRLGV